MISRYWILPIYHWANPVSSVLLILAFVLMLVSPVFGANIQTNPENNLTREFQLKAAYLFNFAKFVDWPTQDKEFPESTLNFCLAGETPVGEALDVVVQGKTIQGRDPFLRKIQSGSEVQGCHVLFVSRSAAKSVFSALEKAAELGVLTVGETTKFANQGGIIEFLIESNKLRFAINLETAQRAQLKLSSQLLKLAQIVRD